MRDLLMVAGVGFTSALVPVVNIEAVLAVRSAVTHVHAMWALALVAAMAQDAEIVMLTGVLTLASAAIGLPPFAVVSVLAGQLRMSLWLFCSVGVLGRWVRFLVILGCGDWLGGWLGD